MKFFLQKGEKEFFTVCLYTCYELVKPDVVMELAWRYGMMEFAMPFFIQVMRELTTRVDTVQKKHEDREKKEKKQEEQNINKPLDVGDMHMLMPGMTDQMMLMPPPGSMPGFNQPQPIFSTNPIGPNMGAFGSMQGGTNPNMGPVGLNQFGTAPSYGFGR